MLEHTREAEALCEAPDGTVWIVLQDQVVRVRGGQKVGLPRPPTKGLGVYDCAVDRQGTPWLSALDEGLYSLQDHGWRLRTVPAFQDGPQSIVADHDRSLLVYDGSDALIRLEDAKRPLTVAYRNAALNQVYTMYRGADLLVGGTFGLGRLRDGRIQILSPAREPAVAAITGIAQTPAGETWLMGTMGIVRLSSDTLDLAFADPRLLAPATVLDSRDGLPGVYIKDGKRDAVRGGDGRLWFATTAGVVWVDPARLSHNRVPPPVTISALKVRGKTYRDPSDVTLPAGTSSGEIDYAAPSLSIPERMQVRYRLEGADSEWIDPGARRQMFFSNLGPGDYRFRVIASNDDGVWNRQGATLAFTIPPTFLQSGWFKLVCAFAILALLWLVYSLRVHRVRTQIQAGMEVRLAERERIARELHDTLLQGFQGLELHFQAAANRIPKGRPARKAIDDALHRADAVLAEGRDRVRELRTQANSGDLAEALVAVAAELGTGGSIAFNLTVEGATRALHPLAREELQRIGEEAIRNAFHHSGANTIEAMLSYRRRQLRLLIRDNGRGLPALVASAGERPGHYGLTGMRERALRIGGVLTIVSRQGEGVEVLLSIPGGRPMRIKAAAAGSRPSSPRGRRADPCQRPRPRRPSGS